MVNALAKIAMTTEFPLDTLRAELKELISENFSEGEAPQFDRIKFPTGGGSFFTFPGVEGEEQAKTIEGVIVYHSPARALYPTPFDGKSPPHCVSNDGVRGNLMADDAVWDTLGNTPTGDCANCPFSQFGGGCKELHRIYLIRPGETAPMLLTLPVMSVKVFAAYRNTLLRQRLSLLRVVTRIGLELATNTTGIKYSKATMSVVSQFPADQIAHARGIAEDLAPLTRRVLVDATDYNVEDAPGATRMISQGVTECPLHPGVSMSLYNVTARGEIMGHPFSDGGFCEGNGSDAHGRRAQEAAWESMPPPPPLPGLGSRHRSH